MENENRSLEQETESAPGQLPGKSHSFGPDKVNWWYESIVDWMLQNPQKQLSDCAQHFNVTQSWLSLVIHSDGYRALYKARREELNSLVGGNVVKQLDGLASLSLDVLKEKLERERTRIAMSEVRETAAMALKALGYGAPQGRSQPIVNNNTIVVGKSDLEEARRLLRRTGEPQETIDNPLETIDQQSAA